MEYVALFLFVILVNVLPAFAPPTWTVLVFFLVKFDMNTFFVILLGLLGATFGRYILSNYITWFSQQLFNDRQEDNLKYLGKKIGKTPRTNILFTFIYSLTPLSTTALFVAAGVARVKTAYVLIGFFLGRLISYTILAFSTRALAVNINDLFTGVISWKSALSSLLGFSVIFLFIFIDWKELLEEKVFRLNFKIWRWNK